ncbi:hypothetical protein CBR_g18754 [Chara braunii]|uniref:Uncharacterized protein n=1 Tax=Chara braunii TaxID=69332 RepID=A0A388KWK7_CHABU|nr:hypothetical protein CBR_g18754 [Chara braunii]|eukprot:GBG74343.1 hypothetical protein CBR_g18754 [Chara braunii]
MAAMAAMADATTPFTERCEKREVDGDGVVHTGEDGAEAGDEEVKAVENLAVGPVLTASEVIQRLRSQLHPNVGTYRLMYSSLVGGFISDPAAMVIPMDDHMVHRSHGVFDTTNLINGHLYQLDDHLDRLLRSAAAAKLEAPFPRAQLRHLLITLANLAGCTDGHLRFWISAGPGGFFTSPAECPRTVFYAVVLAQAKDYPDPRRPFKAVTSTVPMKPPFFATVKTVAYLPNVLVDIEGTENGCDVGIWKDADDCVGEGPCANVLFVSREGVLLSPPFDGILSGCTVKTVLKLAETLLVIREGERGGAGGAEETQENGEQQPLKRRAVQDGIEVKKVRRDEIPTVRSVQCQEEGDGGIEKEEEEEETTSVGAVQLLPPSPSGLGSPSMAEKAGGREVTKGEEEKEEENGGQRTGQGQKNRVHLHGIEIRKIKLEEVFSFAEAMYVGSGHLVTPIGVWDGQLIGDGRPGPVTLQLRELLEEDMSNPKNLVKLDYRPLK